MEDGFVHQALLRVAAGAMDAAGFRTMVRQLHRKGAANYYMGERWEHEGWHHTPLSLAVALELEPCVVLLAQQARVEVVVGRQRVDDDGAIIETIDLIADAETKDFADGTLALLRRARDQMAKLHDALAAYPLPEAPVVEDVMKAINRELNASPNPWLAAERPGEIAPGVWIGAAEMVADMTGVTAIVNCCPSTVETHHAHPSAAYLRVDADDDQHYPIITHAEEVTRFIDAQLAEHGGGGKPKVVIHCYGGINRAGATAVGYLMLGRGAALLDAVRAVYRVRPIILSNVAFREQLVRLAHRHGKLEAGGDAERHSSAPPT